MNEINSPEHWEVMPLEKAVNVFDKQRIPLNQEHRQRMQGEYPYCGANGVVDSVNDYLFDGEYVLLAEDGGYWGSFENSAYLMNGKFWVNNHAHVLQAKQGLSDNYFLMCQLNYLDIKPFISGTTRGKLNQGMMKRVPLALPSLPEQRAIAHILQTIQETKFTRQREIALEHERKAALIDHLFSHGTKGEPRKQTEIGEIPESWEVVEIKEVGKVITGSTPKTSVPEYYGGPYMFISPGDISEDQYVTKTNKYVSAKGLKVSRPLPRDSVLVVCIGATIGKAAMTSAEQSMTNQQINAIISNAKALSHYVYYAVTFRSRFLFSFAGRAAVPIVKKSSFEKFFIPLPPLSEQRAIANVFQAIDEKIAALKKEVEHIDELFHAMLDELMTGKRSAVPLIDAMKT